MARVILFTGRMDAMSKFYGEVLGLKQVTRKKAGRSLMRVAPESRCIPVRHRRDARGRRLSFTGRMSWRCGKNCWNAAQNSARFVRASFASAMARTRMAILSNCPTAEISNPQPNPQNAMSCTTYKYFGSPRVLVSCCKTCPG